VRLLETRLSRRFPGAPVSIHLDSIEPGMDVAEAIESALRGRAVLLALIGRRWLTMTDEHAPPAR
jgi:hypothetical protein